jgi:SHAQKYF class myb-like DNA-binding protein
MWPFLYIHHIFSYTIRRFYRTGRWTREEHVRFVEALKIYGKDWGKVQQHVGSRSSTQARSHAQKFFQKIEKYMEHRNDDVLKWLGTTDSKDHKYLYDFEDSENESEDYRSSRTFEKKDSASNIRYEIRDINRTQTQKESLSRRNSRREEEKKEDS